jgi:DNA-binding PadR family transcriptional regulator
MLSKDLVAASAKPLILSILSMEESYGYAIMQRIKELSEGQIQWTDGMLYPVLHRMEKEGLIESEWKEADTGRKRKYYHIKETGHDALKREQKQWNTVTDTLSKLWKTPILSH